VWKKETEAKANNGILGLSSTSKCTLAMRMHAYEIPRYTKDEYLCMYESTTQKSVYKLWGEKFRPHYLRGSNKDDTYV
jgi:hypothetical protein